MEVAQQLRPNRCPRITRAEKSWNWYLIDEIRQGYGNCRLRIRMALGGELPAQLPGISERHDAGEHMKLTLEDELRGVRFKQFGGTAR